VAANNIVLDVDVLVDLLAGRPPGQAVAKKALEKALARGCRVWLVASSIPGLLDALEKAFAEAGANAYRGEQQEAICFRARDALRGLLKEASVLSSYGFDAEGALEHNRPDGALLLRAANALGGDVSVLTRDLELIRADHRVMDPETFVRRVDATPATEKAIPFVDLACQQQRILPQLEKGLTAVLRHGQYVMGPEIGQLERKLAEYVGVKHALCCASGTDALLLALMAYGVGPGDAIFTSPFTFIATAEVISLLGATPVFVDIDPRTFNIDPDCLQRAIEACKKNNTRTHPLPAPPKPIATVLEPKGIIAVDLFGLPADYDQINAIAGRDGLFVIEDAAQSFGAEYRGRRACSLADIACTSFYPSKPLGGYGDGGAVFTSNREMAERIASIRIHGMGAGQYDNIRIGINARMDTLQAALLLPKLEIFQEELVARDRMAHRYTELLSTHESLQTPWVPDGLKSAWAQYSILSDRRQHIQSALKAKGIPSAVYYPKPLHLQTAYGGLGYQEGDFPESETVSRRILSLPMHPYLTEREIIKIATEVATAVTQ
jgi:UDP-2-acetamido-2-deoxy-ribo-hexuluronate aminotransferase